MFDINNTSSELIMAFFIFMGISLLLDVIFYIADSFIFYKYLKANNYKNSWVIWVPFIRYKAINDVSMRLGGFDVNGIKTASLIQKYWYILFAIGEAYAKITSFFVSDNVILVVYYIFKLAFPGSVYCHIFSKLENKPVKKERISCYLGCFFTPVIDFKLYKIMKAESGSTDKQIHM